MHFWACVMSFSAQCMELGVYLHNGVLSWFHYWLCQNHPLSFLIKREQRNDLENSHRVCWWDVSLYLESHCLQRFQTEVSFLWLSKFSVLWWLLLVKAEQMIHEHASGSHCWVIKLSLAISNSWEPLTRCGCSGQRLELLNRGMSPILGCLPCPLQSAQRPVSYLPTPRTYLGYFRVWIGPRHPCLGPEIDPFAWKSVFNSSKLG